MLYPREHLRPHRRVSYGVVGNRLAAVVIPVFNDWDSAAELLRDLDGALARSGWRAAVVLVDDGSTLEMPYELDSSRYESFAQVEIVHLRANVGHQRAIAIGMAHLASSALFFHAVVVMDSDGEDPAAHVPVLLEQLSQQTGKVGVVFAARTKRLESLRFQLMYQMYRAVHFALTGVSVRVGNFSAMTPATMRRLLAGSDIWNHYAAAVFKSKVPIATVPLPRGERYRGKSHMSYSSLVAHGLSAIAVFGDIVGARLMLLFSAMGGFALLLLGVVVAVKAFTKLAIPGWATNAAGLLIVFAMQAVLSLLVLAVVVLGGRSGAKIAPLREAESWVDSVEQLQLT